MNNTNWLWLSDGLYYFGQGGIDRVEESPHHENGKSEMRTALYKGQTKITIVKEPIKTIRILLIGV